MPFILPAFTIAANLFLGLIVFQQNWKSGINRSFSFIILCVIIWTAAIFMYWEANEPNLAFWASKWAHLSTSLIPATCVYFTLIFSQKNYHVSWLLRSIIFIPGIVQILLMLLNLIIAGVRKTAFGYDLILGPLFFTFAIYFVSYMSWAFVNLLRANSSTSGSNNTYARYVLWAFLLGSIFPIITNIILPMLGIIFFTRVGPSFTVIFVALTAYAITKHRFMDISVVINRTAAEVMTIILLTSGYLGLVWLDQSFISKGLDAWFFCGTILYGILVGNTHKSLRLFFQTTSTKLFLRGKYNYFKEMAKITGQISRSLSRDNILKTLDYVFYDLIEAKSASVYLPEDFDKPEVKEFLALKEPALKNDALIIPCRYEDRPNALIILGPKLSEDAYTKDDLLLLKNLSDQTAIALNHARVCEEMLGAQKQLLMADKLSSMGKVAAGLAHEIKNPLTAIKGMTQALARNPEDQETIRDFNAIIPKEVDRLTRLVEGLSNLGKTPKFQITKVDINTLLENNLKLFESRCRKQSINIIKEFGALPEIETDGERLTQVFTNLILNAIQAMPDGGKLEIGTRSTELGMEIEISDTGQGIPEDKLKDIFEPFFTTKEEGTGLGLAITHKIIKDLGGEITVESPPACLPTGKTGRAGKVGEGTKMRISLPVKS